VCTPARTADALSHHRAIRHQVFVLEQAMFTGSDLDEHDHDESSVCLLGYCDGVPAGSVRLYELDRSVGLWQGDRLAVLPDFRASGVGAPLVRCAVATARALGGREMVAHIQLPNVAFFTRLGWTSTGETEIYVGRPHQRMRIPLNGAARSRV
jgi:putative N-acetyltransferase (TIGR04045 family)